MKKTSLILEGLVCLVALLTAYIYYGRDSLIAQTAVVAALASLLQLMFGLAKPKVAMSVFLLLYAVEVLVCLFFFECPYLMLVIIAVFMLAQLFGRYIESQRTK